MGWTFTNNPMYETPEQFLTRELFRWSDLTPEQTPTITATAKGQGCIAFALRLPAEYLAVNPGALKQFEPSADGSITTAIVVLFKYDRGDFGWKDMDECMGPYETVAPSFLKHLSPTKPGQCSYAQEWRDRCTAAAKAKTAARKTAARIKDGTRIRLPDSLSFNGGVEEKEFVAFSYTRRGKQRRAWIGQATGIQCRIPQKYLVNADIVQA